jgi:hypothetical protein
MYALSFALPAYRVIGLSSGDVYPGWGAFLLGPIGLFGGHYSWLANPAIWMSWRVLSRSHFSGAALWSAGALLVALSFLLHDTIPVGSSGNFRYSALYGYYVWLASIILTVVSASIAFVPPTQKEGTRAG